jgi:hypothetical protein
MALETMRRAFTPREAEEVTGGSNTLLEDLEAAMEKAPRSPPLSPDEWMRWEAAGPGAAKPIDPRASVAFLDSLEGKQAPADVLPPLAPAGPGITPEMRAEAEAANRLMAARKEGLPPSGADRGSLQKLMSLGSLASPIPIASAPVKADVPEAIKGTIAPTTSTSPAPPAGTSSTVKPPPVEAGSGGDDEMASLRRRLGLLQAFEGVGSAASGKNLRTDGGILADRMKQIEALRAKRQERQEGLEVERSQNNQTLDMYKNLFPDKADSLEALRDLTGKGAVFKQGLDAWMKREELTKGKIPTAEARVGLLGAQKDAIPEKLADTDARLREIERHNRAMEAAAALAAQRAAKPAAEERGIKPQDLTTRLEKLNVVTKPYQEMVSSLREADAALSDLSGAAPTGLERVAGAIPGGERFLRPEALRAKRAQEGLKESYQKLKTGLAAVGQELTSFERRFGLNWFADPRSAPLAIESLKEITREALRSAQAPYGGGTGNPAVDQLEVLSLAKKTGSLTSESPVFAPNPKLREAAGMKPAEAPAPVAPARAPVAPAGMVRMRDPSAPNRVARIPATDVDARKAQGWTEVK